jgi:trk system potassium uptake protein TrkA
MSRSRPDGDDGATHFVLGGGRVGHAFADRLRADGHRTVVVDESVDPASTPGVAGDPSKTAVLAETGMDGESTVVVTTPSDSRNLLIAQLVRTRFDVGRVVVLVNDPERLSIFTDAGHEPLCITSTLSETLAEVV